MEIPIQIDISRFSGHVLDHCKLFKLCKLCKQSKHKSPDTCIKTDMRIKNLDLPTYLTYNILDLCLPF